MSNSSDKKFFGFVVAITLLSVILSLGFLGLGIMLIIEVIQWLGRN